MKTISENLTKIKTAIAETEKKHGRTPGSVTLVAVSKACSLEKIKAAISQGQIHFAESYLQEALVKIKELAHQNIIWHYIGRIQSKKAKLIAQNFSWVETIASLGIAELLNKHRPINLPPLNVCIQVNIDNEATKAGVMREEILSLAQKIAQLPRLKLRGLMTIPFCYKELDAQFKSFHGLYLELKNLQNHGLNVDTLSMGMSEDFETAIAAGATIVRIGTAIFGERVKINFKNFTQQDLPLFIEWAKKPHVKDTWFIDGYESLDKYTQKTTSNGYDYPFIIYISNRPIGYIQCSDLYAYKTLYPNPKGIFVNEEPGTFCLDLFIGETEYLNKGYGTEIVKLFVDKLSSEFKAKKILIDPACTNKRAIRCYEKAGFKFIKKEHDGVTESYVMEKIK